MFSGKVFVFCNKSRDKLKVLYWDKTGFVLWYKRLEKHTFKWPAREPGSEQVDFLTCPTCRDVIAASITSQNQMLEAVNATLLLVKQRLAATTPASVSIVCNNQTAR